MLICSVRTIRTHVVWGPRCMLNFPAGSKQLMQNWTRRYSISCDSATHCTGCPVTKPLILLVIVCCTLHCTCQFMPADISLGGVHLMTFLLLTALYPSDSFGISVAFRKAIYRFLWSLFAPSGVKNRDVATRGLNGKVQARRRLSPSPQIKPSSFNEWADDEMRPS